MIRKLLFHGIPLVLPFLVYGLWVYVVQRKRSESKGAWDDAPWTWLLIVGMILMIASLFAAALFSGADPTGTYIPPHEMDGRIVPGKVR